MIVMSSVQLFSPSHYGIKTKFHYQLKLAMNHVQLTRHSNVTMKYFFLSFQEKKFFHSLSHFQQVLGT